MTTTMHTTHSSESPINVLIQFVFGLDDPDALLLRSSFTEDAILDLSKFTSLGMTYPPIEGRDIIVDVCMKSIGEPLDTSHTLSNFRVVINEDKTEATIACYVEGQHFKKGDGLAAGTKENFLVKSRYDAVVVQRDNEWRIKQLTITPKWRLGNATILSG